MSDTPEFSRVHQRALRNFIVNLKEIITKKRQFNETQFDAVPLDVGYELSLLSLVRQELECLESGDFENALRVSNEVRKFVLENDNYGK